MRKLKVELLFEQEPYNQYGCGHRIQYLIKYNRNAPRIHRESARFIDDKGFHALHKIREYWNYQGNPNPIWTKMFYIYLEGEEKHQLIEGFLEIKNRIMVAMKERYGKTAKGNEFLENLLKDEFKKWEKRLKE